MSGLLGHRGLLLAAGGSGPAAYSPAGWYDADDLATLFQDTAGTVPVTADGQSVARWNDKSGNGRDWTQATAANRPTYRTSGGKSWVEFDGVNDWMVGAAGMLALANVAVFAGMRCIAGGADFGTVIGHGQNTTHVPPYYRWSLQTRNSSGLTLDFHSNGSRFDNNPAAAAAGNDVAVTIGYASFWNAAASNQARNFVRINRATYSTGSTGAAAITYANNNPSTLGSQVDGGGDFFKGRVYSILVAGAPVTSQDWIDNWEDWIVGKMP